MSASGTHNPPEFKIGVVITSEWATEASGIWPASEWLMLCADRSR